VLALAACRGADKGAEQAAPSADVAAREAAAEQPKTRTSQAPAQADRLLFADRVWRVKESSTVEVGTTYAFLADGTLVIDSPHGTPLHGQWRFVDGALTLVEEGLSYPTEILELGDGFMRVRSHNPGQPVDMLLVSAADVPLPPARPQ
jgi:hypothetical protein